MSCVFKGGLKDQETSLRSLTATRLRHSIVDPVIAHRYGDQLDLSLQRPLTYLVKPFPAGFAGSIMTSMPCPTYPISYFEELFPVTYCNNVADYFMAWNLGSTRLDDLAP